LFSNFKPRRIDHGEFKNSDFDDRQPEIADETGNIYIAQTITGSTEVPTANLHRIGFTTMDNSKMV